MDINKIIGSTIGLIGSGIGAYNNLSPIEDIEKYKGQLSLFGNTNYLLGSLLSLADLYASNVTPQSLTGNDLYNPSVGERFGLLFSSGLMGYLAASNFADSFDLQGNMGGISFAKNTPQMQSNYAGAFKPQKLADGGGLSLDFGSMTQGAIGLAGAGINMGLNAIGNAIRRKQAERDAASYNALRDFSIDRNQLNFNRVVNDSTDNMFNMMALNIKAGGGPLFTNGAQWSNGFTFINNGGTHEQNPLEGVPMGIAPDGIPNLVEEGEAIYNDYVFSNRLKISKNMLEKYNLPTKYEGKSYAEVTKELSKESEERPNDSISKKGLEDSMAKLQAAQEEYKTMRDLKKIEKASSKLTPEELEILLSQSMMLNPQQTMFDNGGIIVKKWGNADGELSYLDVYPLTNKINRTKLWTMGISPKPLTLKTTPSSSTTSDSDEEDIAEFKGTNPASLLRYAPVVASSMAALSNINKTDYSNPNLIAANTRNINYTPVGDYLALERLPMASTLGNKMASQTAATNAAIMNAAANRAAAIPSLLTAGYKGQTALADAYMKAAEYNNLLTEKEVNFNKSINELNAKMGLNTSQTNLQVALESAIQQAKLREDIDKSISNAKSLNLSNLIESLQGIGREALDRETLQQLISSNVFGSMSEDLKKGLTRSNACGGKLKIRENKRKGLTY